MKTDFIGAQKRQVRTQNNNVDRRANTRRRCYWPDSWILEKTRSNRQQVTCSLHLVKREWSDPATGTVKSGNPKSQDEKVLWRYAARIPKGTTVYKGPVESQGGVFMGGFSVEQVYIPKPWLLQAKGASITEKRVFERNGATSGERNK